MNGRRASVLSAVAVILTVVAAAVAAQWLLSGKSNQAATPTQAGKPTAAVAEASPTPSRAPTAVALAASATSTREPTATPTEEASAKPTAATPWVTTPNGTPSPYTLAAPVVLPPAGVADVPFTIYPAFIDAQHGWLAIGNALVATADGGKTWTKVSDLPGTSPGDPPSSAAVSFVSPQDGWLATSDWFHTGDGGKTWTRLGANGLADPTQNGALDSVSRLQFVDGSHGWAMIDHLPGILRTTDGGATWTPATDPCSPVMFGGHDKGTTGPFSFVSPTVGFAICWRLGAYEGAELLETTDGGQSWGVVAQANGTAPGLPEATLTADVFFLDSAHGWLANPDALYATADGGKTWRRVAATRDFLPNFRAGIDSVAFISPTEGWLGYTSEILKTSDGGSTWSAVYPPPVPSGLRPCAASDLSAQADWQGAGMAAVGGPTLTNRSSTACQLPALPEVRLVDSTGKALRSELVTAPGSVASGSFALGPGQRAALGLTWRNWCQPNRSGILVAVVLAGGKGQITASTRIVPVCTAPSSPSTLIVERLVPLDPPVSIGQR